MQRTSRMILGLLPVALGLALVLLGNSLLSRTAAAFEPSPFQSVTAVQSAIRRSDHLQVPTPAPPSPAGQMRGLTQSQVDSAVRLTAESAEVTFPPILTEPPVASLITVGAADIVGNAIITGAPGAVEPVTAVYIGSLDTGRMTSTMSMEDGSFYAGLVAPAGAWILVKQGGPFIDPPLTVGEEDPSWLNALPGTIVRAPVPQDVPSGALPFATTGSINGDLGYGQWMLEGHVTTETTGLTITLRVTGTLRIASPVITSGTMLDNEQASGKLVLRRFFDQNGQRVPVNGIFVSTFRTPTGLPISRGGFEQSPLSSEIDVSDWSHLMDNVMVATVSSTLQIPANTEIGYYRPHIKLFFDGLPYSPGPPHARLGVHNGQYLPVIRLGDPQPPRLIWTLLTDTLSNGTRGTVSRQDRDRFGLSPHIITQADLFVAPRFDPRTGMTVTYRLEPFLPLISLGDRSVPGQPLIPFQLPSGNLIVEVQRPDGTVDSLGSAAFMQAANASPTNAEGKVYDIGGGRIDDVYQLTTLQEGFAYVFQQYGHHVITLTGEILDVWGNTYIGIGTYDVFVARMLKLESGQLPTTPYQVGDRFSPALQVYPPISAAVEISLVHMPYSDPAQAVTNTYVITGQANRFGYFQPAVGTMITLTTPGEFRVDIRASHTDSDGVLWMGSSTWGNAVEDPATSNIIAHGRRGLDLGGAHNLLWFFHRDLGVSMEGLHSMYPYYSGDVLWGSDADSWVGGNAIIPAVTIQDTGGGTIEGIIDDRWHNRTHSSLYEGLDYASRLANAELPLFSTTSDGTDLYWSPNLVDHYGYAYRSSERPDARVHETISEDALGISYWRFDAEYGGQVGYEGDLPNDLKWEFGGAVFRVISETAPINEYSIYGSLWVLLPNSDPVGSRVMPPFQGFGGGPTPPGDGGPIMVLQGQEVDLFFLPRGVQPGDVLELGDVFSFAGHVGPPLGSWITATVTTPSGSTQAVITGRANKIGYFYAPETDFLVEEPGVWTVQVHVLHDRIVPSTFVTPTAHNSGGVLGSADGQYRFYVTEPDSPRIPILSPQPGYLDFPIDPYSQRPITVTAVPIQALVPPGLTEVVVSYTIRMPGFILEEGTLFPSGSSFTITYDPVSLHHDFANLDLVAKYAAQPGLADPVLVTFLLTGQDGPQRVHRAGAVFFDGEEVHTLTITLDNTVYLPLVIRGD